MLLDVNVTDSYRVKLPLLVSLIVCFFFLSLFSFLLRLKVKEGCNGNGWVLGIVCVYLAIKFLLPLKTAFTELDLHSFC